MILSIAVTRGKAYALHQGKGKEDIDGGWGGEDRKGGRGEKKKMKEGRVRRAGRGGLERGSKEGVK